MSIKVHEFKKVVTSTVIIGMILLFIAFNLFLVFDHHYIRNELTVLNKMVDELGYEINDEMLENFQDLYRDELKKMNEITNDKTSKTYGDVGTFFEEVRNDYDLYNVYTHKELDHMNQIMIMEIYLDFIKDMDHEYASFDLLEFAETEISLYGLQGSAAETARSNYEKLGDRLNQLLDNGEHKNMFFIGQIYGMHSLLFKDIFRVVSFEIMILVVLITAYIMNYEFENKTPLMVYSTRRGRNIIWDKLLVAMGSGVIATTLILGITLIAYFCLFSYKGLWTVPISNYFNWEDVFPLISWWDMSFIQYLICSIVLTYICGILFTMITFILSIFTKNSYISFFAFGILFGLILLIPDIMPRSNNLIFLSGFTPFHLVLNPQIWFTGRGIFTIFKYYEITIVGVWGLLLFIGGKLSAKRFIKEDIH
ncbi:MAG: hypothetical protein GX053_03630 [Tissierella sp.]|nr:hypothetical protein [Tissierella sp.]